MGPARTWLRYVVAIAAPALAIGALFFPMFGKGLGNLLFLAVLVSAWYGGRGPGLLATAVTVLMAVAVIVKTGGAFNAAQVFGILSFAVGGLVITGLVDGLRTARGRAEAEHHRLEAVLTSIGDAVIATDEHGRVTFVNPVAERLTGWGADEATGRALRDVFPIVNEHTRAAADDPVAKVIETGLVVGLANHTVLLGRDGTETPIDDSAAPIRDPLGQTLGVVLVFRDVSDRKRAAEARERLAAIVDSSDDAIIAKDLDGIVRSWNTGAERIFGYHAAEMIGQPITRLLPPGRASDFARILERIRRGERIEHFVTQRLRKDGQVIDVSLTVSPIRGPDGTVVGASKIARDISDHVRSERLLREAKEAAEAANRAKDRFLAALSHELRTPLNPVLLALTGLLDDHVPDGDVRPTLDMMRRNVELEARLIDDLLDVMRSGRGKLALHREHVDIHDVIARSVEICQSELRVKRQRLELDLAATAHHVHADATRLQQVFWNLLRNAVKFTPVAGTITLRTTNAGASDAERPETRLIAELSDTGIGIEADFLPKVFDAFEQGEDASAPRFGGLGLGLAISRAIVEAHGGTLAAASPGKQRGATFTLTLAAEAPAPEAPSAARDGQPPKSSDRGAGLNILLVDDDETTLRLLARLLRANGHKITSAATLADAQRQASAEAFDLIISDLGLPDGSGLDLVRGVGGDRKVPAIALTGYGTDDDLRRSREAGFDEHITKPVNFQLLQGMIHRLGQRPAGPGD